MSAIAEALAPGGALHALTAYRQFMLYRLEPDPKKPGKMTKLPVHPATGAVVSAHDSSAWVGAEEAVALAGLWGAGYGVAFVFTRDDPFWFLDIDNCNVGGAWSPLALELLALVPGAAVEISQSGNGLHAFFSARPFDHGCKNVPLGLELYSEARFVALTGNCGPGGSAAVQVDPMPLISRYFPALARAEGAAAGWTTEPRAEWRGPEDDSELIDRMLAARTSMAAGMGRAATPAQLWAGDISCYADDASSADAALAQHLAFWTGCDCERMERIMRMSGLHRAKWDDRDDYLERTILKASALQKEVFGQTSKIEVVPAPTDAGEPAGPELLSGYRLMAQTQQADHFAGCVYIASIDRVATPRDGILDASRFNVMYGANCIFQVDAGSGGKMKTTDKAWQAFTLSQCISWPKANSLCFRPECPPVSLVREGGQLLYNVYRPIDTLRKAGDPGPFLDILRRLLPIERDRRILLTYMASLVRNPGTKFQWWPVLQGAQGNGKTFLIRAVEYCVGEEYSHLPDVAKMAEGSNFNAWIFGKLFIGMEEVYVPKRRGFLESFKPVVTNTRMAFEAKGQDQFMGDNRANGIMATNHRNGVPIDIDDRRYAVFFTAQQSARDLTRDGMTEAYFRDLYDWFNGRGIYAGQGKDHGKAIINDFLRTCALADEFDPAGAATRAPDTSSKQEAIAESYGIGEAAIMQAIDDDLPGFRGGWVSLRAAVKVAQQAGSHMSPQAVGRFLEAAGYSRHPHLPDGRTNNAVMPDGVKTYLYVREGSLALNFTVPAEIAKAYTSANSNLAA